MFVHCHAHAEISDRQNVRTAQREHQEHVCGPYTNAFHLREMRDDLILRHLREPRELQLASVSAFRHVEEIRRLLLRKPNRTHLLGRELENGGGSERFACKGGKTIEDRKRGPAIQLLIDDGLGQAMKCGFAKLHLEWPDAFDNASHHRVGFLQM